ncbi:self-incompatibility ribonuclease [Diplodia corticola]|uniref:Self-incompatibility ribonuclease n=1 Tax=Diplodia corticola TaxID=236234 RepID=A0A1J9RGT2_9PEZI|nr:self-incompatibility ribonuclease [Diplodia corticola]OJD39800.1 self-incompatibility ribonuclease [Diplodia corticola]
MDDTSFLQDWAPGNVTFTFEDFGGEQTSVAGLDRDILSQRSTLLGMAPEDDATGRASLTLSVPSHAAGVALVRYLYLGNYTIEHIDDAGDPQFLVHAHVLHLADATSCPELANIAMGHLNYNVALAISFPTSPPDLVQTLIFMYTHLTHIPEALSTMLNYCVAAFTTHKLGEDGDFKHLAGTHEHLLSDLSQVNAERGFENLDIPKMVGPTRPKIVDADIANLFAGHAVDLDLVRSRRNSPSFIDQIPEGVMEIRDLPIRVREEPEDADPASPASPVTEDEFVLVDMPTAERPEIDESDSEWSVI